jgi:DNA polymerase/3'-5' exonuclease PolX
MDLKTRIITELDILRNTEKLSGNVFKVRAYKKVIDQLRELQIDIETVDDIKNAGVTGIGKSIEEKITEIIETGKLQRNEEHAQNVVAYNAITGVHGIGHVKAMQLIELGIRTIEDLREHVAAHPDALNAVQKLGLKYYDDILKRIPRKEMVTHEKLLLKAINSAGFVGAIAGSFRRQAATSGDIDLLITPGDSHSHSQKGDPVTAFTNMVKTLEESGYIQAILALGEKKCMAIVKLPRHKTFRRLDILLTPPGEYPYALLYFTGSKEFNIFFRAEALKKGYTINEHEMKPVKNAPLPPEMKTEDDIFKFVGIEYVEPEKRV